MSIVLLKDAASQLAQLIQQAAHGEEVIIVDDNKAVAKLVPLPTEEPKPRRAGLGSGKDAILDMAEDFDGPLEDFKDYM